MKKYLFVLVLTIVCSIPFNLVADDKKSSTVKVSQKEVERQVIAKHLQDVSVTIVAEDSGEGSGVIKTRKMNNGDQISYVWTAAHVIRDLRVVKEVIDGKSGSVKTVVEFSDAKIVKALIEDGRMVGKIELYAEVVRYSAEEDLALLKVRKKNFTNNSVKFYLDQDGGKRMIPPVGIKLVHVGSLLGQLGSNSMTEGIMSQHGRLINKVVFDQTTVTAFRGSSGGGVYLEDGRLVGLVLRGAGETFNLIAPVRRIHDWAKKANVEWAVDDNVKMPTEEELQKMPVEDNGVSFTYSTKTEGGKKVMYGSGDCHLGTKEIELMFPTYFRIIYKNK